MKTSEVQIGMRVKIVDGTGRGRVVDVDEQENRVRVRWDKNQRHQFGSRRGQWIGILWVDNTFNQIEEVS